MYNLELHSMYLLGGKAQSTLPGLIALSPPRKCARGREFDQLVAHVDLRGKTSITPEAMQEWMLKKGALFFNTPGSTTNAMRMMADSINNELFDRNLKKAADRPQVNGTLCMVVLRRDTIYSLVIGQGRIFILEDEAVIEVADHDNPPGGLGTHQSLNCLFSQRNVSSNSKVLLSPLPSPQWTPAFLAGGGRLPADVLGRRLLNQCPQELRGMLLLLSEGSGKITNSTLIQAVPTDGAVTSSAPAMPDTKPAIQPALIDLREVAKRPAQAEPAGDPHPAMKNTADSRLPAAIKSGLAKGQKNPIQRKNVSARRRRQTGLQIDPEKIKARVGSAVDVVDDVTEKVKRKSSSFYEKLFPSEVDTPRSLLLLLAIVIPLIVVSAAGLVYIRRGRTQQFNYYYQQGQQYFIQSEAQKEDEIMYLFNLQAAMMYMEKASEFGQTADSIALSSTIQSQLDAIQGVARLEITSLNMNDVLSKVNITQMVATTNDLYLLDGQSGRALRYSLSGNTYIKDDLFDCGPNPDNPLNRIGALVDILPLPAGNSFGATLFGIDAYGNIEFCIPGKSGTISALIAPEVGWQGIKAIAMYQNYLYVLDPGNNGVYMYPGAGILFEEKPTLFFDHSIPDLKNTVDMEVNADELYLLRANGEMVECTYSHMKDYKLTECEDPAPYSDMRSGNEPQAITFPDAQFVQMRLTAAPDSSIYLLDTHGSSLFHFSLQRNLQKIIQPLFVDSGYRPKFAASSMAISPSKMVFLAFGNQIFYGPLP